MSEPVAKPCLLVVDDDGSVLVSLALLLKQSGFEVVTCDDPSRVPALLASRRIDLVLQDMNFSPQTSGEEGLALLQDLRTLQADLPIVLITAWGSIPLAVQGVKAGAADFVGAHRCGDRDPVRRQAAGGGRPRSHEARRAARPEFSRGATTRQDGCVASLRLSGASDARAKRAPGHCRSQIAPI